jgi:hypothetical protein
VNGDQHRHGIAEIGPKSESTSGPMTPFGSSMALVSFISWRSLAQKAPASLTLSSKSTTMNTSPGRLVE